MSTHLKHDIDQLHKDLLAMCAQVEEMVYKAVGLLSEPRVDKAAELSQQDMAIDMCDVRIEENCLKTLALHQPVAIDLRRIATVLKISAELERVADLAVHIADRACGIVDAPELVVSAKLKQMACIAVKMVHSSIDAYVDLDSQLAREVCAEDDAVDELNREIIDDLSLTMQRWPHFVPAALHIFSASRHVERIADHATNIAEDVVYLVEGIVIRHAREEPITAWS